MSEEDNPLNKIVADGQTINQQRLADILVGLINIDQESGNPIFLDGFEELAPFEKFVAYLLYRRAALSLEYIDESELGVSSSDLAEIIAASPSTVRGYVQKANFVSKHKTHGGYYIPGSRLERAMSEIPDEL